jgi:hypothetical protein
MMKKEEDSHDHDKQKKKTKTDRYGVVVLGDTHSLHESDAKEKNRMQDENKAVMARNQGMGQ